MDFLQAMKTNYQAVEKMLDILERIDDKYLMKFLDCLVRSGQVHIVRLICGDTVQQSDNISPGNRNSFISYLARSAKLPEGLYILPMFFRYFLFFYFFQWSTF